MNPTPKVYLRQGAETRVEGLHPWIFRGEVARAIGDPVPGEPIEVRSTKSLLLGRGFWNPKSQIAVRLWTFSPEPLDDKLIEKRLQDAIARRERLSQETDAYRVVHAEGDGMPGLIVDKYADVTVVQALSLGVEKRLPLIAGLLGNRIGARLVYARGDNGVRKLEGLPLASAPLRGDATAPCPIEVHESGLRFRVDYRRGQKTGFFLDQRENRRLATQMVQEAARSFGAAPSVLDAFCYTGGFATAAAAGGAAAVVAIDSSADTLTLARENAALNGFEGRIGFREGDVFDELRDLWRARQRYHVAILDPPAFAKSRSNLEGALRGYRDINRFALRLVLPGGYLLTFSCSQHVSPDAFLNTLREAAGEAHVRARLIRTLAQAEDHPVLVNVPETGYLKGALLQVV